MKQPYYFWYASDFMGSIFVQGLELEEECCYRRLLDAQATSDNHRISDNSDELRKQCKRPPVAQWNKIWAKLKAKFIPHPDGAGGLINLRMHEILQERDEYLANKSKAGRLGNKKRWGNRNKIAEPIAEESQDVSQSDRKAHRKRIASTSKEEEPPIVPQKPNRNRLAYSPEFEGFWLDYPASRRVKKADAWKAWQRIKPTQELRAKIRSTLAWQKTSTAWTKDKGQYIPHPATWLNAGQWDDEPSSGLPAKQLSVHDFL